MNKIPKWLVPVADYLRERGRCPCCDDSYMCYDDCSLEDDDPERLVSMMEAREMLGVVEQPPRGAEPVAWWECDTCGRRFAQEMSGCFNSQGDDDCDGNVRPIYAAAQPPVDVAAREHYVRGVVDSATIFNVDADDLLNQIKRAGSIPTADALRREFGKGE